MDELNKKFHTRNRKPICLAIRVLFFVVVTLFPVSIYGENKIEKNKCPTNVEHGNICLTKDCTLTAATFISVMDPSVDPCEDFYKFSCANFIRKNFLPDNEYRLTTFMKYLSNYLLQQKDLVENYNPYGEPDIVYNLLETYHVCINATVDKDKELEAFRKFIIDDLDGWPLALGDKWTTKYERLDDYLAHLYLIKESNPLIDIDEFDSSFHTANKTIRIDLESSQYLLREFQDLIFVNETKDTKESKLLLGKKNFLLSLLKLFGDPDINSVNQEIENIIEMLQYIMSNTNESYSRISMTIEELNELTYNTIDWLKLINARFNHNYVFNLTNLVSIEESIKDLPNIWNNISRRSFVNAMVFSNIRGQIGSNRGPPQVDELKKEVLVNRNPERPSIPRWKNCLQFITEIFPMVLTRMFIKTFVDKHSKITVDEMIQLVEEAYKIQIIESDWLDEETKKFALIKADAIRRHVGYPDFIFNDTAIQEEHAQVPKVKSTQFENYKQFRNYVIEQDLKNIGKKDRWFVSPLEINAFYDPEGNSIWFPSGILQLPFFGENRLAAVNFGMIGSIIGHEIGHAFDVRGSRYDELGNLKNWWSNETRELYEERGECFINQYNEFCPEDLQGGANDSKVCIRGEWTLRENMADNTGLKAAYEAYKLWIQKHGEEKRLPGLEEFSPEQIFFISNAYLYCEIVPIDKWLRVFGYDPHSAGKYRVLGSFSNNEDFRKAFNCPLGKLNRGNESCLLW